MSNHWTTTDPSTNQQRRKISETIFQFKEDRVINHETKETRRFQAEIELEKYSLQEMIDNCEPFGYTPEQVKTWVQEGENLDLIAECIFEMIP